MSKARWAVIAFLLFPVFATLEGQLGQAQETKARNVKSYTTIGPFKLSVPPMMDPESYARVGKEVREFIWEHWRRRRLAFVQVSSVTVEGEQSTFSYYVEPDESDRWHIRVTIEGIEVGRGGLKRQRNYRKEFRSHKVGRVELPTRYGGPTPPIPDDEDRPPEKYRVQLKDQGGKILYSF